MVKSRRCGKRIRAVVRNKLKVRWTIDALASLKDIYDYYKKISLQGAQNVKRDIFNSPKRVIYPEQYQIDEVNSEYRRIIVRDYKVLYKEIDNVIVVFDVICTLTDPSKQKT